MSVAWLRKPFIVIAMPVPAWITAFSGAYLVSAPSRWTLFGVVALYGWFFGVYGIVGLLRSLFDRTSATPSGIRTNILLLTAGLVAAIIVTALLVWLWQPMASGLQGAVRAAVTLTVFPGLAVAAAVPELRRLRRLGRRIDETARPGRARWWGPATVLLLLPLGFAGGAMAAKDAVIYWYARDFLEVVVPAAETIARGRPYCIVKDAGTVDDFAELDTHAMLARSLERHLRPGREFLVSPHFGIVVGDVAYWWSFRDDAFYYVPGHGWSEPPAGGCPSAPEELPTHPP